MRSDVPQVASLGAMEQPKSRLLRWLDAETDEAASRDSLIAPRWQNAARHALQSAGRGARRWLPSGETFLLDTS